MKLPCSSGESSRSEKWFVDMCQLVSLLRVNGYCPRVQGGSSALAVQHHHNIISILAEDTNYHQSQEQPERRLATDARSDPHFPPGEFKRNLMEVAFASKPPEWI